MASSYSKHVSLLKHSLPWTSVSFLVVLVGNKRCDRIVLAVVFVSCQ